MKGILLSLGILIPTILPSQTRLVPFPGIFSTYIGAHLSKRQFRLCPLSRELFFNPKKTAQHCAPHSFRPLSWGLFFNDDTGDVMKRPTARFRPLSWGLFFNGAYENKCNWSWCSFRPLSWGLSFNCVACTIKWKTVFVVFVPFLGDFLSI